VFGNKRAILVAILEMRVVGDDALASLGSLRSGLSVAGAADTIWAIASPDLCLQLMHPRG